MAFRQITEEQVANGAWAADATIEIDLTRVGLITRLDMTNEITPSATLTAANQPDGLFRTVGNMRIRGGSHVYFTLPAVDGGQGGTLLHYLNRIDGHGIGHADGAIAAPTRTFTFMNFVYHCGSRVRDQFGRDNPFDLSAFVPASAESQLVAEWTTYGNDVLDDTVTISSSVMRFTISRVMGSEQEIRGEMQRQGIITPPGAQGMVPANSAVVHPNGSTTSDFDAEQINIVPGAYLKRISWLSQDATADRPIRAGDQVTDVAIKVPKTSEELYRSGVEMMTAHMEYGTNLTVNSGALESAATEKFGVDFNAAAPLGIGNLDLRPRAHTLLGKDYGFDLRNHETGDFVLGLLITTRAAGDDTLTLFERYAPYKGPLSSK